MRCRVCTQASWSTERCGLRTGRSRARLISKPSPAAADARLATAAAIAQHGMVHDGVVDFLEGDDALAAAQKVGKPQAQRVPKRQGPPLQKAATQKQAGHQDTTTPQRQTGKKPKASVRVAVGKAKFKRT